MVDDDDVDEHGIVVISLLTEDEDDAEDGAAMEGDEVGHADPMQVEVAVEADIPHSPEVGGFEWSDIQRRAIDAIRNKPSFVLMLDVGLGKTLVAAREMLVTPGWKLLISSGTVQTTWERQMREWYPATRIDEMHPAFVVISTNRPSPLTGKKMSIAEQLADPIARIRNGEDLIIAMTDSHLSNAKHIPLLANGVPRPAMVVVDENEIRNLEAKRGKALVEFLTARSGTEDAKPRFLLLTATPYQNGPRDLFTIAVLMGKYTWPGSDQWFNDDTTVVSRETPMKDIREMAKDAPRYANELYNFLVDKIMVVRGDQRPWKVTRQLISSGRKETRNMLVIAQFLSTAIKRKEDARHSIRNFQIVNSNDKKEIRAWLQPVIEEMMQGHTFDAFQGDAVVWLKDKRNVIEFPDDRFLSGGETQWSLVARNRRVRHGRESTYEVGSWIMEQLVIDAWSSLYIEQEQMLLRGQTSVKKATEKLERAEKMLIKQEKAGKSTDKALNAVMKATRVLAVAKRTVWFTPAVEEALSVYLDTFRGSGSTKKFLLFAWFVRTRNDVAAFLQSRGLRVLQFVSALSSTERSLVIQAFQGTLDISNVSKKIQGSIRAKTGHTLGEPFDAMIVGIGVLSTGVTLTAAHDTVMIPETFNPTAWIQAEGRTNRRGQHADSVNFYYLASRNGDTGRLFQIIRIKWGLAVETVRALEDRRSLDFKTAMDRATDEDIQMVGKGGVVGLVALHSEEFTQGQRNFLQRYIPDSVLRGDKEGVSIEPLDGLVHPLVEEERGVKRELADEEAPPPAKKQRIGVIV